MKCSKFCTGGHGFTEEKCKTKCTNNEGCPGCEFAITYNGGYCHLANSNCNPVKHGGTPYKFWKKQVTASTSGCRSGNHKYTGATIETRSFSLSECENECNKNGHCKFWSWSPGSACSFFSQTPSKVADSGSYTGEKNCPAKVHPCDQSNKGGCDDSCTKNGDEAVCRCSQPNFQLHSDGKTCVHPCDQSNKGGCEDSCRKNGNEAVCTCGLPNFQLHSDGKTCDPLQSLVSYNYGVVSTNECKAGMVKITNEYECEKNWETSDRKYF